MRALAEEFIPYKGKELVQSMCQKLSEKFASDIHAGPVDVASFLGILDEEENAQIRQDLGFNGMGETMMYMSEVQRKNRFRGTRK